MMQSTRERIVSWDDPMETAAQVRSMSGLDALRAVRDGQIPPPPIARLMNFTMIEADEGRAVFEGIPGEEHYNPIGVVHGGFAMTLLDSALGCSVQTLLPRGVAYTTTDVQVRLIRGITKDTGPIRAEATATHVGRSTAVAEAKLYDRDRRLLAVATTGCAIIRP